MKSSLLKSALALGLALLAQPELHAQHGHLNAGAAGTQQNARLLWANGADFIASSRYVKTLDYTNAGRYAGYYQGGITPTALPATPANAGPDPQASAPGSFLQFTLACLSGPEGGTFNFWESTGGTPALTLAPGQAGTNLFPLSQGDGSPGSDPYGHIHGRRFTATKPGVYMVALTVQDNSTNGAGGGPIHTPSAPLPVWFQAGVSIKEIEPDHDHTRIRFGAAAGRTWQLEATTMPGTHAPWTPVGLPVIGNDLFHEVDDDTPVSGQRYFRVRSVTP